MVPASTATAVTATATVSFRRAVPSRRSRCAEIPRQRTRPGTDQPVSDLRPHQTRVGEGTTPGRQRLGRPPLALTCHGGRIGASHFLRSWLRFRRPEPQAVLGSSSFRARSRPHATSTMQVWHEIRPRSRFGSPVSGKESSQRAPRGGATGPSPQAWALTSFIRGTRYFTAPPMVASWG